jgi:hypothetical protein
MDGMETRLSKVSGYNMSEKQSKGSQNAQQHSDAVDAKVRYRESHGECFVHPFPHAGARRLQLCLSETAYPVECLGGGEPIVGLWK